MLIGRQSRHFHHFHHHYRYCHRVEYREDPESRVTGWQHRHTVIRDITINYTFGRKSGKR